MTNSLETSFPGLFLWQFHINIPDVSDTSVCSCVVVRLSDPQGPLPLVAFSDSNTSTFGNHGFHYSELPSFFDNKYLQESVVLSTKLSHRSPWILTGPCKAAALAPLETSKHRLRTCPGHAYLKGLLSTPQPLSLLFFLNHSTSNQTQGSSFALCLFPRKPAPSGLSLNYMVSITTCWER